MILTTCAACAAPLANDHKKRCSRCKTRYCDEACQRQHWAQGHEGLCRRIKRAGGAEKNYAGKKYQETVAEAVEACAEETKGQTCYICTQAVRRRTKEGLVRMCACRGTDGFVHVSCLLEQAKILVDEGEENNLDLEIQNERFALWYRCRLCGKNYHGLVRCALGWACWMCDLARREAQDAPDWNSTLAMEQVAIGLYSANRFESALGVFEAKLSAMEYITRDFSEKRTLKQRPFLERQFAISRGNIANCLEQLGRAEEELSMRRDIYARTSRYLGPSDEQTLVAAQMLGRQMVKNNLYDEARSCIPAWVAEAERVHGSEHDRTLLLRKSYADALFKNGNIRQEDRDAPMKEFAAVADIRLRVFGAKHPNTMSLLSEIKRACRIFAMQDQFNAELAQDFENLRMQEEDSK